MRELLLNLLMLFLLLLPALGIRFTGGQPLALFAWLRRGKAESGERLGQRGGTLSEFIAQLGLLGAKLANLRVERQALAVVIALLFCLVLGGEPTVDVVSGLQRDIQPLNDGLPL